MVLKKDHFPSSGQSARATPLSQRWIPFLVLAVSLAFTFFLWRIADRGRVERAEQLFQRESQEISSRIIKRLHDHEQVLLGANALFHVKGDEVTRIDWRHYVSALNLGENHPGILGVGFTIWLNAAQKDAHVRQIRAEGFPEYVITPEGERPGYTSILWLEPFNWRNQRAFGYDMYSEPKRRRAMAEARDTGKTKIAAGITLRQETEDHPQHGLLMYVPSYRQGIPTDTVEGRRRALRGFVYSPIRMNDFVAGTLSKLPSEIDFEIHAGGEGPEATLLYSSRLVENRSLPENYRPAFSTVETADSYGVKWRFFFATRPAFEGELDQGNSQVILLTGILTSVLLSGLAFIQARSRRQALAIAEERLQAEAQIRETMNRLRRASKAAQEANRAKSEFLANMSHEIRTPMTVFLAALEHLQELDSDPMRRQLLEMAESSAERLRALIDDILDFSKIEARRVELHEEPVLLRPCVREAVALLSLAADKKGLKLEVAVAADVPEMVSLDPDRLSQVLVNLVGNAVKFTDRGRVKVTVEADHRKLRFAVSDTGPGIPPEKKNLLFESFSQVDSSRTRRHGGTGLGLAISKGLVELMGGSIGVESRPGKGSTFFFTLPLRTPAGPVEPSVEEREDAAAKPDSEARILLAEDEPAVREMIRMVVGRRGYEVEAVSDGEEAISRWREGDFDLILMDVQMPKVDGIEAARTIRRLEKESGRKAIRIIALTAHARPEIEEECLAAGMDTFITKPVNTRTLYAAIEDRVLH